MRLGKRLLKCPKYAYVRVITDELECCEASYAMPSTPYELLEALPNSGTGPPGSLQSRVLARPGRAGDAGSAELVARLGQALESSGAQDTPDLWQGCADLTPRSPLRASPSPPLRTVVCWTVGIHSVLVL